MKELQDYGGAFNRNIQLQDCSKELLVQLIKTYSRFYMALDGFWYLSIMDRINEKTAIDCDLNVWDKQSKYEIKRISKLLNIEGKDITSFLKCFQFFFWNWNLEYQIQLNDNDSGIWTVFKCPTMESLEREGKGRDNYHCALVEAKIFNIFVQNFNPDIQVRYIKLPPRLNNDDIFCQWEFKIKKVV